MFFCEEKLPSFLSHPTLPVYPSYTGPYEHGHWLAGATTRGHTHHDALMELVDGNEDLNKNNCCHPIPIYVW